MATKELTSLQAYVVPRVNLLPPEIGIKKAEHRSYAVMGLAVAGAGVGVVALYLGQASRVAAAKGELQRTKTESAKLTTERATLQSVQDVYAAADANEALLTRAYENRVLWSVYMHNLSIRMPENVWVTQFTGTATPDGAALGSVGSLTFAGKALDYNDVAAWLESVAQFKGVTDASFTTAAEEKPKSPTGRTVVVFSSTASLTPAAITAHKKPGSR